MDKQFPGGIADVRDPLAAVACVAFALHFVAIASLVVLEQMAHSPAIPNDTDFVLKVCVASAAFSCA
jgi:hypothetical protein